MRALAVLLFLTATAHADDLATAIASHQTEIDACRASQPKLRGKVFVDWEVLPNGSVSKPVIAGSTLMSPQVEACLLDAIGKWRFPPAKAKRPVTHGFALAGEPAPQANVPIGDKQTASELLQAILKQAKSAGPCWIAVDESITGTTDLTLGAVKGAFFCDAAIAKALQEKRQTIVEALVLGDGVGATIRILSQLGWKKIDPAMAMTGAFGPARRFPEIVLMHRAEQGQLLLVEIGPPKKD